MDIGIFLDWLKEPRTFSPAPECVVQHLFCDNATGHCETSDVKTILQLLNTELRKLRLTRKYMIRSGLSLETDRIWRIEQLLWASTRSLSKVPCRLQRRGARDTNVELHTCLVQRECDNVLVQ